jgi:WD40 repeat protein
MMSVSSKGALPHRISFARNPGDFKNLSDVFITLIACIIVSTTMPQTVDWMEDYMKLPIMLMETMLLKDVALLNIFKTRRLTVKQLVNDLREGVKDHHKSGKRFDMRVFLENGQEPSFTLEEGFFDFFKKLANQVCKSPRIFPWISLDTSSAKKKPIPRLPKGPSHICEIEGHVVAVHPHLQILALAGYAGCSNVNIAIYRILESGELEFLRSLAGGRHVSDIAFHATLPVLAVADQEHLRIFAFDEAYNFRRIGDYESTFFLAKPQPSPRIKCLVFQSETNILAAIRGNGTVKLFRLNPDTFELCDLFSFESHKPVGDGIKFVPGNPRRFVTCGMDHQIKLWEFNSDSTDCRLVSEYIWKSTFVTNIVFDPHNPIRMACYGWNNASVLILDIIEDGLKQVMTFDADVSGITSICWHPKIRGVMAVGGKSGKVCIWQIDPETKTATNLLKNTNRPGMMIWDWKPQQKDPEITSLGFTRCSGKRVKLVVIFNDSSFTLEAPICPKQ